MICVRADILGPIKYSVEIYSPKRGSTVNTKRYKEKLILLEDLCHCLPDYFDIYQLVRAADQDGSSGLGDEPIELSDGLAGSKSEGLQWLNVLTVCKEVRKL
jgi:hypothetical protein